MLHNFLLQSWSHLSGVFAYLFRAIPQLLYPERRVEERPFRAVFGAHTQRASARCKSAGGLHQLWNCSSSQILVVKSQGNGTPVLFLPPENQLTKGNHYVVFTQYPIQLDLPQLALENNALEKNGR